jgi:hypothetical protein
MAKRMKKKSMKRMGSGGSMPLDSPMKNNFAKHGKAKRGSKR